MEHDESGRLVWDTVVLSAPRQVGKSWLERGLCAWRVDQGDRFGEDQAVLHVAHKLIAAKETWRPAARWAVGEDGWRVRWAAGEEKIEKEADGSRWMLQAASDGAGVAFSLSMALVDEAWRIPRQVVDGAIAPTLAEAESPQVWLVSTAGDSSSDLMGTYRAAGLARLEMDDPGSLLLIEWSAPPDPDLDIDDPGVWRAASPHWDARRAERVARARETADEYQFRQQWLNQWVPQVTRPVLEPAQWSKAATWSAPEGPICFGFDVAPDRSAGAVAACGNGIVEVVEVREGVGWLEGEVRRLVDTHDPVRVVGDPGGPAVTVVEALGDLGDRLVATRTRDLVAACGGFYDAVAGGKPTYRPHPGLDTAAARVKKRTAGGSWVFDRSDGGHVLVAAVLAHWGDRQGA
ncbi:MAG: hypothetical protein J2P28_10955, partial [Actinobacteria bacterium]|nr:hypothetical protein [Actinomycetota bacterium]